MKKNAGNTFLFLGISILLIGCATEGGRSEKSNKAEEVKESRVCRGRIGKQTGVDALLQLAKGDPVTFACNASHHYAQTLAKTYGSLGRAEEEKRALRFVENLENGTGDPGGLNTLAATDVSSEQKSLEAAALAGGKANDRLLLLREAQNERNLAIRNIAAGGVAFIIGVKQVQAGLKSDDPLVKLGAAAKAAEMAQVLAVLPAIADTNAKINDNLAHLDAIINVPKENAAGLKNVKPD